MAVWQYSALLVHRWISIYHLRRNGKLMIGKQRPYLGNYLQPWYSIDYFTGHSLLLMGT
jgi:hypothetical protein